MTTASTASTVSTVSTEALLHGKSLSEFHKGMTIRGGGKMGLIHGYAYVLEAEPGTEFESGFKPYFTPGEMLSLGVFEGKYLNDCTSEFPREWFLFADALGKLSPQSPTSPVTISKSRVVSRCPCGSRADGHRKVATVPPKKRGGQSSPMFIRIPMNAAGFSGTVAIGWVVGFLR